MAVVAAAGHVGRAAVVIDQVHAKNRDKTQHRMAGSDGLSEVVRLEVCTATGRGIDIGAQQVAESLHGAIVVHQIVQRACRYRSINGFDDLDAGAGGCCNRHILHGTGLYGEAIRFVDIDTTGREKGFGGAGIADAGNGDIVELQPGCAGGIEPVPGHTADRTVLNNVIAAGDADAFIQAGGIWQGG